MNLDWNHFTPWASLAGGLLIGVATALYLLGDGRIAGIAGIVSAPLRALLTGGNLAAERVRLLFIGGLLIAPWAWQLFAPLPEATVDAGPVAIVVAGSSASGFAWATGAPAATACAVSAASRSVRWSTSWRSWAPALLPFSLPATCSEG